MDNKGNLPGWFRIGGKGVILNNKLYYLDAGGTADASELWEYDISSNTWSQKTDFPGQGRSAFAAFAIGTKLYAGTGSNSSVQSDFYEYDPSTNAWTAKTSFPGAARTQAVGFSYNSKGYIGGGRTCCAPLTDYYEYDPVGNSWTSRANFPGSGRFAAIEFVINGKAYIGTGIDYSSNTFSDFYEYDISSNTWTSKASFPGVGRYSTMGFSIGNYGYIGLGYDGSNYRNDFYMYNPATNTWTQKANFTGTARSVGWGASTSTKGYFVAGYDGGQTNETYEYNPNDAPTLSTSTVTSITGTTAVSGGNITNDGGESVTARGIVWNTATAPTIALATKTSNGTGTGSFSATLTGLSFNTTYYVRAYATNIIGTSYGTEYSFTTNASAVVTITKVDEEDSTSAVYIGEVTSDGGTTITERGIVISTTANPTISNYSAIKIDSNTGIGSYSATFKGLEDAKKYYGRAYAKNADVISYSPAQEVLTHDQDGIDSDVERLVEGGDGNGDGTPDYAQNNVVSLRSSAADSSFVTIATNANLELISVRNLPQEESRNLYNYPFGINAFTINASSATVTSYYHGTSSLSGYSYRKQTSGGRWITFENAVFGTAIVGGKQVATSTIILTDGGIGDFDGKVNGIIVDPGGPVLVVKEE